MWRVTVIVSDLEDEQAAQDLMDALLEAVEEHETSLAIQVTGLAEEQHLEAEAKELGIDYDEEMEDDDGQED